MVKVNLLNKQESQPEEPDDQINNGVSTAPEMPSPSEPEPEKKGKKGGVLKYILLIFFALIATGSAYFLYTEGWSLKDFDSKSGESLIIADEASMDESPKKKTTKPSTKPKVRKLSTIKPLVEDGKTEKPKAKPKTRIRKKVSKPAGRVASKAADGRILLGVFNSIVTSLDEDLGDLKLTVSNSRVTLAVSLNSREEAAFLLRKIRQKWPLSNLRAVRFEQSKSPSTYNYATQFDGSIKSTVVKPVSDGGIRRQMKLSEFKKLVSEYLTKSGLTLSNFEAKKAVKGKSGTVFPMVITADGANESIVLFMESLMKLEASYNVSRASLLSKDDAVSKMSLYLSLNNSSDKPRS